MIVDIVALHQFYQTPLGRVAQRFIARTLVDFIRGAKGCRVAGLGFGAPFLRPALARSDRVNLFMAARQGVAHWPYGQRNLACLAEPLVLPVLDGAYERALVVHLLENVGDPDEFMHEVWRILAPGGRVVVVVPNRRGIWARVDSTPFGQGRPYSVTQLDGLLRRNGFDVVAWTEALYIPPIPSERFLRTAAFWERIGVRLSAPFAGLHVVEAMRQEQRPIPVRQQRRRLRFAPDLSPAPSAAPTPAGASYTPLLASSGSPAPLRDMSHADGNGAGATLSPDEDRLPARSSGPDAQGA